MLLAPASSSSSWAIVVLYNLIVIITMDSTTHFVRPTRGGVESFYCYYDIRLSGSSSRPCASRLPKSSVCLFLPQEFLVNHISGSFVEMVLWWLKDKKKHTPEELDYYFSAVIEPIL